MNDYRQDYDDDDDDDDSGGGGGDNDDDDEDDNDDDDDNDDVKTKVYPKTFWHDELLFMKLNVSLATNRNVYPNFEFSTISMKNL